jgi:LysR family hydrogen peroxide-inducible transcriptional activator
LRSEVNGDELDGQNLLLLGQGNCFRDQVLESCPRLNAPDALEHSLEGSSLETIRYMVASGAGVAVMPSTAADPLMTKEPMVRCFRLPAPSRNVPSASSGASPSATAGD